MQYSPIDGYKEDILLQIDTKSVLGIVEVFKKLYLDDKSIIQIRKKNMLKFWPIGSPTFKRSCQVCLNVTCTCKLSVSFI